MILCLGSAADETFLHMLVGLRQQKLPTVAVDVVHLARTGAFAIEPGRADRGMISVGRSTVRLSEITGCWIRLPDLQQPEAGVGTNPLPGVQRALSVALHNLPIRSVNPPLLDPSNFSKPAHMLYLAAEVGLEVPDSCVTNIPERAGAFVDRHDGQVVYKGTSSTKTWVRQWNEDFDRPRLELIGPTPVLFQRMIAGPDVRVHVAAGTIVAEKIVSASVDYRTSGARNQYSGIECPRDIADACIKLSAAMNCPLLGIDFKIDADSGKWVLLEANPLPCFQGYDARSGGRISRAIAAYLAGPT